MSAAPRHTGRRVLLYLAGVLVLSGAVTGLSWRAVTPRMALLFGASAIVEGLAVLAVGALAARHAARTRAARAHAEAEALARFQQHWITAEPQQQMVQLESGGWLTLDRPPAWIKPPPPAPQRWTPPPSPDR